MKTPALVIPKKIVFSLIFICFLGSLTVFAQKNKTIIGHWELDRIVLSNKKFEALSGDEDELKTLFRTVVLQKLVKEDLLFT